MCYNEFKQILKYVKQSTFKIDTDSLILENF